MLRLIKCGFAVVVMLLVSLNAAYAEKADFRVNAPTTVMAGEVFQIEFSMNAKPASFAGPNFEGMDVIAGPTLSEGQSTTIINGKVSQSSSYTYIYVVQIPHRGKATVSAATARIDGEAYRTRPLTIEAVDPGQAAGGGAAHASQGSRRNANVEVTSQVRPEDLQIRMSVNRNSVYKGQPVRVTFKIYTRVQLSNLEPKFPAFNGFWTQDLDVRGYQWQRESLGGRDYNARVIREVLLYPQQSGTLHIEQFSATAIVPVMVRSAARGQSLIDELMGGGMPEEREVRKRLNAAPIAITVKDLPAGAPASFTGAVGRFQLSGAVDKPMVSANGSDNLVLKVSGNGNLPLIQAPDLKMPSSFEQFNKKTTESLTHNANGIAGYRQFEYPFIPRAEGSYTIDPVEFSYFDPDGGKYVTLTTTSFNIEVRPDSTGEASGAMVSGVNKEDLKILDKSIRFINIGNPNLSDKGRLLFGSLAYWLALVVIGILAVVGYSLLRKRLSEMQNVALVRNRKANKVALQRLQAALHYMNEHNERSFYDEMLRALWGYMSDKLNIPVSNLTKDNIREELQKRGVAQELSSGFIDTISTCECAQYSPSSSGQMNEVYNLAANQLSQFESLIKK